jgi:hypothetical protein
MAEHARLISLREPAVGNIIGFIDGVGIPVQCSDDVLEQNAMYNGYYHDTMCNNVFAFSQQERSSSPQSTIQDRGMTLRWHTNLFKLLLNVAICMHFALTKDFRDPVPCTTNSLVQFLRSHGENSPQTW